MIGEKTSLDTEGLDEQLTNRRPEVDTSYVPHEDDKELYTQGINAITSLGGVDETWVEPDYGEQLEAVDTLGVYDTISEEEYERMSKFEEEQSIDSEEQSIDSEEQSIDSQLDKIRSEASEKQKIQEEEEAQQEEEYILSLSDEEAAEYFDELEAKNHDEQNTKLTEQELDKLLDTTEKKLGNERDYLGDLKEEAIEMRRRELAEQMASKKGPFHDVLVNSPLKNGKQKAVRKLGDVKGGKGIADPVTGNPVRVSPQEHALIENWSKLKKQSPNYKGMLISTDRDTVLGWMKDGNIVSYKHGDDISRLIHGKYGISQTGRMVYGALAQFAKKHKDVIFRQGTDENGKAYAQSLMVTNQWHKIKDKSQTNLHPLLRAIDLRVSNLTDEGRELIKKMLADLMGKGGVGAINKKKHDRVCVDEGDHLHVQFYNAPVRYANIKDKSADKEARRSIATIRISDKDLNKEVDNGDWKSLEQLEEMDKNKNKLKRYQDSAEPHYKPPAPANEEEEMQAADSMTTTETRAYLDQQIKEEELSGKEENLVNWDAALAAMQLADSEDLTSSAWRIAQLKVHGPYAFPDSPQITGKEFNERNPPIEKYNETSLDPNRKLNEVQEGLINRSREDRRKLLDRTAKRIDSPVQTGVDFVAGILGGATAGDALLAAAAPAFEAKLVAARSAPQMIKVLAKIMQALRKNKGLKGSVLANLIENAMFELAAIPTENFARKEMGVEEFSDEELATRIVMGILFTSSMTSLAHVITHSKFWRELFQRNPEKAMKKFKEQTELIKEGVPYSEKTLLDSWDEMGPMEKNKIILEQMEADPDGPPPTGLPKFGETDDVLTKYMNELLEMEHRNKLEEFEAKGDTEGVETPKKETRKEIDDLHDSAASKFKEQALALANCFKGK